MIRSRAALLFLGWFACGANAANAEEGAKKLKRDAVFGPDKVWTVHLRMEESEYQAMQPPDGGKGTFGFGFGPPKKDDPKVAKKEVKPNPDGSKREVHSSVFGVDFPYAKGDVEFEGTWAKDVGVRYRGNSTYLATASTLKRPFRIDMNHFVAEQKLHGLGALYLGCGVMDTSRIREPLAYSLFREANVPAPRTAFVKLYLTVPGKYDKTYVGLYSLIEPVDKPFLKKNFKDDNGMLLKPERVQGLPYFGENWAAYKDKLNPKREPTAEQKRRYLEFAKLVNLSDDATFARKIGDYLDVDGFLRFVAVNSMIGNLDSFLGIGHNYYLYLNPKTSKFEFIPWDVDLTFGNFAMVASAADQIEWSIAKPYLGRNRLVERILAIKEHDAAYRTHFRKLAETVFAEKQVNAAIAVLEKTVREPKSLEKGKMGFGFGTGGGDVRSFVTKRTAAVLAQLDGKSEGKVLAGFGFGGPGKDAKVPGKGFGGPGSGLAGRLATAIMGSSDANKDGKLALTEARAAAAKLHQEAGGNDKTPIDDAKLAEAINRLLPPPPGFGGLKLPAPPKGFGPGAAMTGSILKLAAADKTLSLEKLTAAMEKLFSQSDKNKDGSLDEKELTDGLATLIPAPAFGPPFMAPLPPAPKKD